MVFESRRTSVESNAAELYRSGRLASRPRSMRQKVPEPFCGAMDITVTGLFRLPVLRQHRLAICSPSDAVVRKERYWRLRTCTPVHASGFQHRVRSGACGAKITPWGAWRLSEGSADFHRLSWKPGLVVCRDRNFPAQTSPLYFGGCSPGLFAHLSMFQPPFPGSAAQTAWAL